MSPKCAGQDVLSLCMQVQYIQADTSKGVQINYTNALQLDQVSPLVRSLCLVLEDALCDLIICTRHLTSLRILPPIDI